MVAEGVVHVVAVTKTDLRGLDSPCYRLTGCVCPVRLFLLLAGIFVGFIPGLGVGVFNLNAEKCAECLNLAVCGVGVCVGNAAKTAGITMRFQCAARDFPAIFIALGANAELCFP